MGILIAKAYPTKLFLNLADHTYVECGTGARGWKCWGGKTGGKELRRGTGSTRRADKIARPDEKAGIKCYLVNGVCHQAANRILLSAGITVRGARGYSVSQALFGPYGRVGFWPCKSPFNRYPSVTGDIPACDEGAARMKLGLVNPGLSEDAKADWQYIKGALAIYSEAEQRMKGRAMMPSLTQKKATASDAMEFQLRLFDHMVDFNIGPQLERKQRDRVLKLRERTELRIEKLQAELGARRQVKASAMPEGAGPGFIREYAAEMDRITVKFQDDMANAMSAEEYEALFDLPPDERIVLADPEILQQEYGIEL